MRTIYTAPSLEAAEVELKNLDKEAYAKVL
jgi:hypothetical protein